MGSPPLPQPVGLRVMRVSRRAKRIVLERWVLWGCFLRRVFQKKRKDTGRRQRAVLLRRVWMLRAEVLEVMVVMVLMVAMAFCAAALRVIDRKSVV